MRDRNTLARSLSARPRLGIGAIIMKPASRMANYALNSCCGLLSRRRSRAELRNNPANLAFLFQ
jgi:hypothetical protein